MKVYLAGGMRSDWRNTVKAKCDHKFSDPTESGFKEPVEYTTYDNLCIITSDIVFAYFEKENPSGIGMAYEIGMAKALNKTIIFVRENTNRYGNILEAASDICVSSLEEGIRVLKSFENIP